MKNACIEVKQLDEYRRFKVTHSAEPYVIALESAPISLVAGRHDWDWAFYYMNDGSPKIDYEILVLRTGDELSFADLDSYKFLGTIRLGGGTVIHVFYRAMLFKELVKEKNPEVDYVQKSENWNYAYNTYSNNDRNYVVKERELEYVN